MQYGVTNGVVPSHGQRDATIADQLPVIITDVLAGLGKIVKVKVYIPDIRHLERVERRGSYKIKSNLPSIHLTIAEMKNKIL